jgi:hypothetical protein
MAINKPLQQAIGVAAGSIATIRIPPEALTLVGAKLVLGGTTFDKTKIDKIRVKVGARVIWDITGAQINAINNYKGGADVARTLLLDFTERTQAIFPVKEVGGLDLMTLAAVGEIFLEITINAAAVAPTIQAFGYFEQQQGNPMVLKLVPFTWTTNAAGRFTLPLNLRGALVKRLWVFYSGTGWTAATNGNCSRMEVKKNGVVMYDQYDLDARFDQVQYKKTPQAGLYVVDFIVDDNHDATVTTIRDQNGVQVYDTFEFNAYITDAGGAQVTAVAEVIDTPTNL